MFFLKQLQQELQRLFGIYGAFHFAEQTFSTIQNAGLQIILGQLEDRLLAFVVIQIGSIHKVVVHAQSPVYFAATAEQTAQREMQLDSLRIDLDHLDKSFDGFVLLFVEQEVQPLKIRIRQHTRF